MPASRVGSRQQPPARPQTYAASRPARGPYLESGDLGAKSDGFVFDTQIIAQGMAKGLTIREIPNETRYFDEASQIAFGPSVRYGLAILKTMVSYKLHAWGIRSAPIFR